MLSAKLEAVEAATSQLTPQDRLRDIGPVPQFPTSLPQHRVLVAMLLLQDASPPTPLPTLQRGERGDSNWSIFRSWATIGWVRGVRHCLAGQREPLSLR